MKKILITIGLALHVFTYTWAQQEATIREYTKVFVTYPYSSPDPIPSPDRNYYPYFRYDGFTCEPTEKSWKVVSLENNYISLSILPEIGGKIWGATEKSTGREFIYSNSVVKFRDIAMRGPWTSGGIEFNFGTIGHAPTTSAPVDYLTRNNQDGSVSCIVGATDLLTQTRWEVEIRLPKDKAYFTTKTSWYNPTPLVQPYYQWHNSAYQVEGDLEYCFPGDHRISHGGDARNWPTDYGNKNLSWYKNNNFGPDQSDMIVGSTSGFYAAYWHDFNYGSGHYCPYSEKLGRKVFSWSQARSGSIWESLLTDHDGQYVEMQAGRLFTQAAVSSTRTPFKHYGFDPYTTDVFKEYWFPILSTEGVVAANSFGALNVKRENDRLKIYFCPLQHTDDEIRIYFGEELQERFKIELAPLNTWSKTITANNHDKPLKIVLGNNKIIYSEKQEHLTRPLVSPGEFDWGSVYGLFLEGMDWIFQNRGDKALESFSKCLKKDSLYVPALNQVAELYYRKARFEEALSCVKKSLSVNTYDPKANFIYGLINKKLGHLDDAADGFSVASISPTKRTASYIELAKLFILRNDLRKARQYAQEILEYNRLNQDAFQLLALISRKEGDIQLAETYVSQLERLSVLNHFAGFERLLLSENEKSRKNFISTIRNELPNESYMEMACWYEESGCTGEALKLLEMAPGNLLIYLKMAYLHDVENHPEKAANYLDKAVQSTTDYVFPFREENIPVLKWAIGRTTDWKPGYLLGTLNWSLGNLSEAKQMYSLCGQTPDRYYFYAAKPALFKDDANYDPEKDLLKSRDLGKSEWRTSKMLIDYYLDKSEPKQALDIAIEALDSFPLNYEVRYTVSKCMLANKKYTQCLDILDSTVILPNEGASRGRLIYQQAAVMISLDKYEQGDFKTAIAYIKKARLWPENLGVGQPYHPDDRLEDFFEAECLSRVNKKEEAKKLYRKVIAYSQNKSGGYKSNDYMYLLALDRMGQERERDIFLDKWRDKSPDDPVSRWSEYMLKGDVDSAQEIAEQVDTGIDGGTPWNPKRTDPGFELVKAIACLLTNR